MSVRAHPCSPSDLCRLGAAIRRSVLTMARRSGSGHVGSALSVVEILLALYFGALRYDPRAPKHAERDRCILSKGHACAALYAALAEAGFFPREALQTYLQDGSRFAGHPSAESVPGIEYSSGSLGHGLGVGAGMALAGKLDGKTYRTFVVASDGECDEGSVWEAALFASHHRLRSLTCIVDCNGLQAFGRTADVLNLEPIADKWRAFGWNVAAVDGHDCTALLAALAAAEQSESPTVIIARTTKGKGVPFMENSMEWHYRTPSDEEERRAIAALPDARPEAGALSHA